MVGRESINNSVGPNFLGIIREDGNSRLDSRLNNHDRNIGEITVDHQAHLMQNRWHSAA